MEKEIVELYRRSGYTPKQIISELTGLLGAAILSNRSDTAEYSNDKYEVKVIVTEIK